MSTALVPIGDMQMMAQAFAKGGLFGTKTPEQCLSLLLLAQAEGKHPALAMRDFDVIQGKPAKKSEAMLRDFLANDGAVEWHEMTDERVRASFMHPKGSNGKWVPIDWDIARAKKAGLTGKDNWSKYPRQMLSNRVISEGCRRVYPAATSGMYEPGEVKSMAREEKNMGPAEVVDSDGVIDNPTPQAGASPSTSTSQPSPAGAGPYITADQAIYLEDRAKEVGLTVTALCKAAKVERISMIEEQDYKRAVGWLDKHAERIADSIAP